MDCLIITQLAVIAAAATATAAAAATAAGGGKIIISKARDYAGHHACLCFFFEKQKWLVSGKFSDRFFLSLSLSCENNTWRQEMDSRREGRDT